MDLNPEEEREAEREAEDCFGPMARPSDFPTEVKEEQQVKTEETEEEEIRVKTEAQDEEEGEGGEGDDAKGKLKEGMKKRKRLDWVHKIDTLYLDVFQGGKLVQQVPLGNKFRVLFGRWKKADVVLHNPSISRKHAAIAVGLPPDAPAMDAGGVTLLDLGSNNGTYWAHSWPCRPDTRKKVQKGQSATLKEGYCFRFGESSRSFVIHGLTSDTKRHATNPNYNKKDDAQMGRNRQLARDLSLQGPKEKRGHGAMISSNPFKNSSAVETTAQFLPSLADDVIEKLKSTETTFSFHKRRKTEMDEIKKEHEHKQRKRVLELKKKEATAQEALDMQSK